MKVLPNIEEFEERAAICQFESEATKAEAEDVAAQDQGFKDADDYWSWLADYVINRAVPR
ncbi:hypothetical protein SAMN05428995_1173 [Loktanella sp. DSM 29012]|uniref:hypothetical protein n=1 Tax=Loktanella sp. DSM 29012 TaxID=1881056 RepID=UPI0008C1EFC8|nr:hypothetical protein [Loktanella sp. DSM 29012]SEQ89022.1 hypothetical protein SAMN05428995_1173 [Loktanella sp. DSM 29012]